MKLEITIQISNIGTIYTNLQRELPNLEDCIQN